MNFDRHTSALDRLHGFQIDTILAGAEMDAMRPRFNTLRDRHENGTAPVAVSAFQLFQTPATIAAQLVALLDLEPGARVLEPSAGLGRILDALKAAKTGEVFAVEKSPELCAELYLQNRTGVKLVQRDFLSCTPEDFGQFDAVAMNPPFHMRADIAHTLHALKFLRPGGKVAGLCMDTERRASALKARASVWLPLPAGTFRSEGTNVPTVLFLIQNN